MMHNGSIPPHVKIVAVRDQISCDLEGEAVILHLREGVYYGLNEVAAKVWELVQEPRTATEIRDILLESYDVDPEACLRDLLNLLQSFSAWNLIEWRNGRPSGQS